jgi:DNA gyrase subunit A
MDITTNLTNQIQSDYLAYSMAVIIGRAIPSLTDGLKPAQRRVLTAMKWLGLKPDGKYMKSARVEGEAMGKLHPHGGAYGVMVTLAAPHNNNVPYIDGQGNWGSSVDGAAAARYTEARLTPFAWDALLADSDTWQLTDNYDGSLKEPTELNVKVPAVLLNGQDGIGVGFATKIPPHSLRDICDSVCKGSTLTPSFPTGCDIVNDDGLTDYQRTGVGTLRLRARCEVGTEGTGKRTKSIITFTNLPSSTNPEKIGQQIKDGLDKGTILGVTEVRDDSDLTGDRIAVTLKAGTDCDLATRQLYHYTDLESKYSARLLVVDGTKPVELSPSELVTRWKAWRLDRLGVIFAHERDAKEHRLEVVNGLLKAIDKIDAVIKLIRSCQSKKDALIQLVATRTLKFTRDQATAILEMRLHQLTGLDSEALLSEKGELETRLAELKELIEDRKKREGYMKTEIKAIGTRHGEKRRSNIIDPPEGLAVEKGSPRPAAAPKPRFLKVDLKKGVVEQAKGPRGAIILEKSDKLITLTQDGTLRKLPSNYKGPLGEGFTPVVLAKKETEVKERSFLLVFTLGDQLKAMAISGEDLAKATSKGKQALPEGATMLYFGEGSYVVPWASSRKKKVELFPVSTKQGKPGGKGVKVANLSDIQ